MIKLLMMTDDSEEEGLQHDEISQMSVLPASDTGKKAMLMNG